MRNRLPRELSGRFVLRHGQSAANVAGVIASSLANAGDAFGLTPTGCDQVRRSVVEAQESGLVSASTRVVTSPLLRARETAAIAAELLGTTVRVDERLIERGFGSLELSPDTQYDPVWLADRADPAHQQWGVESVVSILDRVSALLLELDGAPRDETIVLCTHGDVAAILLCAAMGHPVSQHRDVGALGNGELRALAGAAAIAGTRASASVREA
ncbi:MAG: histidine phosphatase family protein [Gemmatimonadaceae bacterium]